MLARAAGSAATTAQSRGASCSATELGGTSLQQRTFAFAACGSGSLASRMSARLPPLLAHPASTSLA
eukprot:13396630-Alexandrium_andersonii.AAC.1